MDRRETLQEVERAVTARLDPLLTQHGFRPDAPTATLDWFERTWRNRENRSWVHVSVSVDPRDIPYFVGIAIGEGNPSSIVDREIAQVALWRYVADRTRHRRGYEFHGAADVGSVIERIEGDLAAHAPDFLSGDHAAYRRLRGYRPPFPKLVIALSVVGQLLLMPWRAVWWAVSGGPRRLRDVERAIAEDLRQRDPD